MSIFNYTLPSGAQFRVTGPADATQLESDRIFYEQVASGSLTAYEPGQTLSGLGSILTKFELSRIDRGTAGVDSLPVLSIAQGLPSVGGEVTQQSLLAAIQNIPLPVSMPDLSDTALVNPIDEADIVNIKGSGLAPIGVGPLSSYDTQKILAQIAAVVDQRFDVISLEKGIGIYGFTCDALELVGYVKPGTSGRYITPNPSSFVSVMTSPSVWTGRRGVTGVDVILASLELQNQIQLEIMQATYQELLQQGTVLAPITRGISVSSGQVFTNSGLQSINQLYSLSLLGRTNLGRLNFTAENIPNNTNLLRLLNSSVSNISTISSGAVNTANILSRAPNLNFNNITAGITAAVKGDVGSLIANASKYGATAAGIWARNGSLQGLASLATGVPVTAGLRAANILPGTVNAISRSLTNVNPGTLSNLSASLNNLGKATKFATNFSSPLTSLNNLGNLSRLGNLSGAPTSVLNQLTQLRSRLGDLNNIGSLANVFGSSGDLVSGTRVAGAFNNTVNRATVDAAFARIVGNSKVPIPIYEYPSPAVLAQRLDISQAQAFVKNLASTVVIPPQARTFGQGVTI